MPVVVAPRRGDLGRLCSRSTPGELGMEGKGAAPALLHTRWLLLVFSLFPIFLMFLCLVKTSLQQGLSTQLGATGQSEHFSGTEKKS